MTATGLIVAFVKAGRHALNGLNPVRGLEKLGAALAEDNAAYVRFKAMDVAEEYREMGYEISDMRVHELLHRPDPHYCGNVSPASLAEMSGYGRDVAVLAMREAICRELNIPLPRDKAGHLKTEKTEDFKP